MKRYLVGGAVRDLLLGRMPAEMDFAFAGNAESFIQANPDARKVGRDVSVILLNRAEYTPLAEGGPVRDVFTRDLTINALVLDEDGRLYAHPLAFDDLRDKILRLAAPDALARDPLRLFRVARFSAVFPDFIIHPSTLETMRETAARGLLDALPAERVGRELLKALAAPRPSRFLQSLSAAGCLHPWFRECDGMEDIPAAPPRFRRGTVLEHTSMVMDALQGDALAAWMGMAHDLGKTTTPADMLPHHYGHEKRGKDAAERLARRLALPGRFVKAGALAAELHMPGGLYPRLRTGTRRDLLMRVHGAGLDLPFWDLVSVDSGEDRRTDAMRDLALLRGVKLPASLRGKGKESGERLRLLQCEALKRMYTERGFV
jgi:tRNA nucleotidyltransferase (CCA-adding enzyme)